MCVCVYACMCVCVYVCMCVCVYVWVSHIHIKNHSTLLFRCILSSVCLAYMCLCHTYKYIQISSFGHTHIHKYTHTYTQPFDDLYIHPVEAFGYYMILCCFAAYIPTYTYIHAAFRRSIHTSSRSIWPLHNSMLFCGIHTYIIHTYTQPFDDLYIHPVEAFGYYMILYCPPFLVPLHIGGFALYMAVMGMCGVLDHSGIKVNLPVCMYVCMYVCM
jgi:hypothetical protein